VSKRLDIRRPSGATLPLRHEVGSTPPPPTATIARAMPIDEKSECAPKSDDQPEQGERDEVWPYHRVRAALVQVEGHRDLEILRILDDAGHDE
jgi:hypothetical protein